MDWEGFLRRVFQRLPNDVRCTLPDIGPVLDRALKEAHLVALQASFEAQLLRSGVLCVDSYLPRRWLAGSRLKVAIALLDEAGCRAYQDQYKRDQGDDWCITANLPLEGIDLRNPSHRYRINEPLHTRISEYIERLEKHRFFVDGEECAVSAKVSNGDHRAYTTFIARNRSINFQSLPKTERLKVQAAVRSQVSGEFEEIALEDFDFSASQLKIALALQGHYLPIESDVWTSVAELVQHPARSKVNQPQWRKIVKTIALSIVLGHNNISIRDVWKSATGKFPKKGAATDLKLTVKAALFHAHPQLERPLTPRHQTPDGVPILGHMEPVKVSPRGAIRHRDGHLQKINTSYNIETIGTEPDVWSTMIAHEAWLIREVILSMPEDLPILPVHDQLYFPSGHMATITQRANSLLQSLASRSSKSINGPQEIPL